MGTMTAKMQAIRERLDALRWHEPADGNRSQERARLDEAGVEFDSHAPQDICLLLEHIAWQDGEIARLEAELAAAGERERAWREHIAAALDEKLVDGRLSYDAEDILQHALATPPSVYARRAQKDAAVVEVVRKLVAWLDAEGLIQHPPSCAAHPANYVLGAECDCEWRALRAAVGIDVGRGSCDG